MRLPSTAMATTAASPQPSHPARPPTPLADTSTATGTGTGTDTAAGTRNGSASQTPLLGVTSEGGAANGFGVLQHTGPPVQDDIPGLYRDGRVRNPVPSKLKGKTDASKGNFGVMHIDLTTTNESRERDAAAKRTSEGTQLAARLAQTDRYVPIRRSKFVYRPEVHASNSPPQLNAPQPNAPQLNKPQQNAPQLNTPQLNVQVNAPQLNAPQSNKPQLNKPWPHRPSLTTPQLNAPQLDTPQLSRPQLNAPYNREPVGETARQGKRTSALTAAETTAEQARLLTLLRSLDPDLVVDQLCKGLEFFGGVASEHTSPGGSFPVSAEANGSGSLFVGWLAEIFPALGQEPLPSAQQTNLRRPRGRPKGSRNAKGKQVDHVGQRLASGARAAGATTDNSAVDDTVERAAVDDSWVDVDDTVADTEGENSQVNVERVVTTPASSRAVSGPGASGGMPESGSTQTSTITPTPKRRGRPKGSKNRPKDVAPLADDAPEDTNGVSESPAIVQSTAVNPPESSSTTGGLGELGTSHVKKRKGGPGRPKGSKNRPKESVIVPDSQPQPPPPTSVANDQRSGPQSAVVGDSDLAVPAANSTSSTRGQHHDVEPGNQVNMASQPAPETISEPAAAKPQASEAYRAAKRKRKASQEGRNSNAGNESLTAASASDQNHAGGLTAITSESPSSPQMTRSQGSRVQDRTQAHQPVTKRQKLPGHQHQDAASNSRMTQASQNSQTGQRGQRGSQSIESTRTTLQNSSLIDANTTNLQRSRNQMSGSANRSSLQQPVDTQQPQSDLRLRYSQSLAASSASRGVERAEAAEPYSLNVSSRQGMYDQGGLAQEQQHQHLFHQQEQHRPILQNRPNGSQHRLSSSGTGQIPSTLGQNGDNYTESTSDAEYHGLVGLQQPTYSTHMTGSASTREDSYRSSTPRPIQHQSSTLHARQEHPVQNTAMSSYQDYSDSAFLASLTTVNQASLAMSPTQYNVNGAEMQRASPNINSTYGSSHLGQSSFDGSMTESAMRERMYHTSRRQ
ncbi:hypothetical protein BDP81DRAFT_195014 [Colletotrichum phormii]|uniref:Uncharacterized protein n=1 Tax=Colletotrichum phormii TaxID=359342 RepID=A0AAJ0EJF8_9PEZI|nr:uncharacterized protein BDP81DRAFT_195014 [Colletotrichum phormii]KAK1638996.1 hypothetical protein BDP81DRAFT_195014 [Colletotrichum phormii]